MVIYVCVSGISAEVTWDGDCLFSLLYMLVGVDGHKFRGYRRRKRASS